MAGTSDVRDFEVRMAERRLRGARLWPDSPGKPGAVETLEQPFRSPLGWVVTAILSVVVALSGGLAVIVVPAGLACREQAARGYFAGDDFTGCLGRGVSARFREFDGRLRRVVLHSGQ